MKKILTLIALGISGQLFAQTETFTTSGTGTWLCPAGVTSLKVECWGGGGGAGGTSSNVPGAAYGGGGAGGGYAILVIPVTPGNNYDYYVGKGGNGGVGGLIPTFGEDSWFSTSTTVMAKGGTAGTNGLQGSPVGGSGGIATGGSIGGITYMSGNGADGDPTNAVSGGGGGGAGDASIGGNASGETGGIGGSVGGGNGANGDSFQGLGGSGFAPGGGGAGGVRTSGGNKKGGGGGDGQIIITYNAPLPIVFEYFKAEKKQNGNSLEWKISNTGSEAATMVLEYSMDGKTFSTLNKQTVAKEVTGKVYTYNDCAYNTGTNFYRIALQQADNGIKYSQIVTIVNKEHTSEVIFAPNPVKNVAQLRLVSTVSDQVRLIVTDLNGKILIEKETNISKGINDININAESLHSGIYFISIEGKTYGSKSLRFVKN